MAFFELLRTIGGTLGDLIKPIGGRQIGGFDPDSSAQVGTDAGTNAADVATFDSAGHLSTRGPVMTDEGSFRDDFANSASLTTTIPGASVTFTNGSATVTGVGTAFLTDLRRNLYVRLSADTDADFVQIDRIVSDTELILAEDYTGAGGTGAGISAKWHRRLVGGGTLGVASSICTLGSATASGNIASIHRDVDYLPLIGRFRLSVSQRIANQRIRFGFADLIQSPTYRVLVELTGTTNTTGNFIVSSSSVAADTTTLAFTYPSGLTSANTLEYQITFAPFSCSLLINGQEVARISTHIPDVYDPVEAGVEITNTGAAASNTNVAIDEITVSNQDQVQISASFRSDPILVRPDDEPLYLSGNITTVATTADQVICSTTVPTGKTAYIVGYTVTSDVGGVNGTPVKIGRNPPITEPGTPGAVGGALFRAFSVDNIGIERSEAFPIPIRIGTGGDVIGIFVTPAGAGATVWRGSLNYILR
jgi:hypothetical protein